MGIDEHALYAGGEEMIEPVIKEWLAVDRHQALRHG
jgi:hypothetical protein